MIFELDMEFHQRARVYLDQLPDACFESENKLAKFVGPTSASPPILKQVAVEWVIPRGGMMHYGLLGIQVQTCSNISASVCYLEQMRSIYRNALIAPTTEDKVLIGLSRIYAEASLRGMSQELTAGDPVAAAISCQVGAHSIVGSSESMFYHLGRTVAAILAYREMPTSTGLSSLLSRISKEHVA